MSRDLSLNKIAPHVTASSVQGVKKPDAVPGFSSYVKKSEQQYAAEEEGRRESDKGQAKQPGDSERSEVTYPEIFKLIANPSFSELFALAVGEEDAELMYIVKALREERGVSDSIPVGDVKQSIEQETSTYLNTDAGFSKPSGQQFTGTM